VERAQRWGGATEPESEKAGCVRPIANHERSLVGKFMQAQLAVGHRSDQTAGIGAGPGVGDRRLEMRDLSGESNDCGSGPEHYWS